MVLAIRRDIPLDVLTANHYIFGQVNVSQTGILGLFTDIHASQIEISDASVTRIVKPDKVVNYSQKLWVAKRQIFAACLSKAEHLGSISRTNYARVFQYPVHVITPVYEFSGILEWPGRFDFSVVTTDGPMPFLVFYDVKLIASLFPALVKEAPAVVFNRNYIDAMLLDKTG